MAKYEYLMENEEEALRLDLKIKTEVIQKQALFAGIKPGMRVADIGCGSGKITSILHKLVQPSGTVVGVDASENRLAYAKEHYAVSGVEFKCKNILQPLDDLGLFDFVWVRFVLEYYRSNSFKVVKNISKIVKPGGVLCLIDLDNNCLSHYEMPSRLEKTLFDIVKNLEEKANFDPYVGRKLYSFLHDLGYNDINVDISAHQLIFGDLTHKDEFNWLKKIEVISKKVNYQYKEYKGGYEEFLDEFNRFFTDPRRFTYTPVILCRGIKPPIS
jgi:ubiquinone/menaquinone biosynthesis C-methylase UbiE